MGRILAALAVACLAVGSVRAQSGGGMGEGGGQTPWVQMEQAWFTYFFNGGGGETVYASTGGGDTVDFDGEGNVANCVSNGFQGYVGNYHPVGNGWKSAKQVKIDFTHSNGGAAVTVYAGVNGADGFWYEQNAFPGISGKHGYFTEVRLTLQQMRTVNGVDDWVSLSAQEIYTFDY